MISPSLRFLIAFLIFGLFSGYIGLLMSSVAGNLSFTMYVTLLSGAFIAFTGRIVPISCSI
jgi:hypothetical protein